MLADDLKPVVQINGATVKMTIAAVDLVLVPGTVVSVTLILIIAN